MYDLPPEDKKNSRDLLGCVADVWDVKGCDVEKTRKWARSLQIPTFCFVVFDVLENITACRRRAIVLLCV